MARKTNSTPAQDQILIQVIEAETELTDPHNLFGPVNNGYIVLHAIMFRPRDAVHDGLPINYTMDINLQHPHITATCFAYPSSVRTMKPTPGFWSLAATESGQSRNVLSLREFQYGC